MIILTLRTDKPESEIRLFNNQTKTSEITWQAHRQLAETLHVKLKDLLDKQGLDFENIQAIVAYQGPGSFTGLRIGISVANALAYSLEIPIVGTSNEDWEEVGIERLLKAENDHQVIPEYGSEAHITPQKK